MFNYLYRKLIHWSSHAHAPYYLVGVSFVESSFFPIPPDVMLIPMVLGKPLKAWEYALIATISSVLGGLFGYMIGYFAFETIGQLLIDKFGYQAGYNQVVAWFGAYGWLAVLLAGFTPIPYKLFTITAGAVGMPLPGFVVASIFGRAGRFFLVALLIKSIGKRLEEKLIKYIDRIGWGSLAVCLIGITLYFFYKS